MTQSNSHIQFLSMQRKAAELYRSAMRKVSATEREEMAELSTIEAYCSTCRATVSGKQMRNHTRLGHNVTE